MPLHSLFAALLAIACENSDGIPLVFTLQAIGELGVGSGWADGVRFGEGLLGCSGVGNAVIAYRVVANWADCRRSRQWADC